MDTQFTIHNTQRISQVDVLEQKAVEVDRNRPSPLVGLIVSANFYTIAAVALVLLRLAGRVDWPWGSVTAPLWAPMLLTGVLVAIFALANTIMNSFSR